MPFLFLLAFICLSTPVLAEGFLCAGSQGTPTEAALPPGVAAKPARIAANTTGTRRALVLFARFKGEPANPVPSWAADIFNPELPGSFSHFYDTMSFGQRQVRGQVASRVYESAREAAAYLSTAPAQPGRFGQFAQEILQQADGDLDFAQFDNDGADGLPNSGDDDGIVDALFLVMNTVPQHFLSGSATGIGSLGLEKAFLTGDVAFSGMMIQVKSAQSTIQQGRTFAEAVGAMCHEYGHVLGLPDLFNIEFLEKEEAGPEEDSAGSGAWCLMGWGALGWHGDDGPNSFCAWSRMQLGWAEAVEATQGQQEISLEEVGRRGQFIKISIREKEFFLLEYRKRSSTYYDRHIPGEGLLIWHVDERRAVPVVDLECADGKWLDAGYPLGRQPDSGRGEDNLDFWAHETSYAQAHGGNLGDSTDAFEGRRFRAFTPQTNPDSYSTDRSQSLWIEDIRFEGGVARMQFTLPPFLIKAEGLHLEDANRDGVIAAGEIAAIVFSMVNQGTLIAQTLKIELSTEDSLVEVLNARADFLLDSQTSQYLSPLLFPRVRFSSDFYGTHPARVLLQGSAFQGLVWQQEVVLEAISPRQRIETVTLIDSLGNGDGVPQFGEFIRLVLNLEVEEPALLRGLRLNLRSLDKEVIPVEVPRLYFQGPGGFSQRSIHTPEFLLSAPVAPGARLRFEFEVDSGFEIWRDTLLVAAGAGEDHTPPRVRFVLAEEHEGKVRLSLPAHLIEEASAVRSAMAIIYSGGGARAVARIPLEFSGRGYEGFWAMPDPGTYLLEGVVEDRAGNQGRSALQVMGVGNPAARLAIMVVDSIRLAEGALEHLVYDPKNTLLALASGDKIRLYEAHDLKEKDWLKGVVGVTPKVKALAFSPEGRWLATGGQDRLVRIWDALRSRQVEALQGHEGGVGSLAFSPDGQLLASGGRDGTVRLWDGAGFAEKAVLRGATSIEVMALAFHPGGRILASAHRDRKIRLWDVEGLQEVATLTGHKDEVSTVAFSPDGQVLVSGSRDGTVRLWDVGRRAELAALEGQARGVTAVAFSPDGQVLASGGRDGTVRLWDVDQRQEFSVLAGHIDGITSVAFSPDGQALASGDQRGKVLVWRMFAPIPTAVEGTGPALPQHTALLPAYPNPFNPSTTLRFSLPQPGEAELSIYNLLGQRVAVLVKGVQEAGTQVVQWNGRDEQGREVASGVYFYRLQAGAQVETRKLLLLR